MSTTPFRIKFELEDADLAWLRRFARILARVGFSPDPIMLMNSNKRGASWMPGEQISYGLKIQVDRNRGVESSLREVKGVWPIPANCCTNLSDSFRVLDIWGEVFEIHRSGVGARTTVVLWLGAHDSPVMPEWSHDQLLRMKHVARLLLSEKVASHVMFVGTHGIVSTDYAPNSRFLVSPEHQRLDEQSFHVMQHWLRNVGTVIGGGDAPYSPPDDEGPTDYFGDLIRWDSIARSYMLFRGDKIGSTDHRGDAQMVNCLCTGLRLSKHSYRPPASKEFHRLSTAEYLKWKRISWDCGSVNALLGRLDGWYDEYGPIHVIDGEKDGEQIVRSVAFWDVSERCVPIFREMDNGLVRVVFAVKRRR